MEQYQFSLFSWVLFFASMVGGTVAVLLWRRRNIPEAFYLALLEIAVVIWSISAAMEATATTASLTMLWGQIGYLGVAPAPVFFLLFGITFSQQDRFLTRRNIALLWVVPVITILMVATNSYHHLHWTSMSFIPHTNLGIYHYGPWFLVHIGYSYLVLLTGVTLLLIAIVRFSTHYTGQIMALIVSAVLPIASNMFYVFKLNFIPGLDWTPIAFIVSGGILGWSMFRYQMFDLVPVARKKLVDMMPDPVFVLDARERIVDMNPVAKNINAAFSGQIIGRPVDLILVNQTELLNCIRTNFETRCEIKVEEEENERYYDLRLSTLYNKRGHFIAKIVVLHDISSSKKLEKERELLIAELQDTLTQVKTLTGLLPICANCKNIRDDHGYWRSVEGYLVEHSEAEFSHGICPDCMKRLYPEFTAPEKNVDGAEGETVRE